MLREAAENVEIIIYLMAAVGGAGVIAKLVNSLTLYRLVKASKDMSGSTHKLVRLIRAKYEYSCMARGAVENTNVFVEKYIYEYCGFLFHIHTWRQIEKLSVWFAGILAVSGGAAHYTFSGAGGAASQCIALGAAEIMLLSAVIRISDESYKISAVKMYMTDYLDNICAPRLKRRAWPGRMEQAGRKSQAERKEQAEQKSQAERKSQAEGRGQSEWKEKAAPEIPVCMEAREREEAIERLLEQFSPILSHMAVSG